MNYFHYQNDELYVEQVAVTQIAQQFGTPCYIYSRAALEQQWQAFNQAFASYSHRICYAVKANSNLAILNLLARQGSSFDVVSGGELTRVLAAGGKAENIVFSGVGKATAEIKQALAANIFCFNVESKAELIRLAEIAAQMGQQAKIALRVNPDIDVNTHPYIATGLKENKFGIAIDEAVELYQLATSFTQIKITGIACHIGSQITALDPFVEALDKLLDLIAELKSHKITLQHIDLGGGLGVCYRDEIAITPAEYAAAILPKLANHKLELLLEPGRALVANAGILVTQIEYLKHQPVKNFAIVDVGMNDLLRPALYEAWHGIMPVKPRVEGIMQIYDVVGPVCETGDFIGKNRHLQVAEKDLLAIFSVGAYGFVMSSNYNARPRAAEVLVDGDQIFLARPRETVTELFANEKILP